MLIVCPSCATSYDVKPASLGPDGRQVRCVRCHAVWHAAPGRAESLVAAAAAIAPAPPLEPAPPFAAARAFADAAAGESPDAAGLQPAAEAAGSDAVAGAWFEPPAKTPSSGVWRNATEDDLAVEEGADIEADEAAAIEAPSIAPVDLDDGRAPLNVGADEFAEQPAAPAADVESVAARRQRRRKNARGSAWPLSLFQSGILALVVVDAVLIGWRADVVRALPQTASFYAMVGLPVNLRGLDFDEIKTTTEQHEGVQILVVEGNIVNDSRKLADVPRIKFILRNAARQEIYSWTAVPSTGMLPPGQAVAFRSRLASPPPDGRDVVVRFVTRRDLMAASH